MEDGIEEFMVQLPPDFPLEAIIDIAGELTVLCQKIVSETLSLR